jgi:hypothetical protein
MFLWFIVGLIFLIVCIHDFYNAGISNKSILFRIFEGIAGIASFKNAFTFRRKYKIEG